MSRRVALAPSMSNFLPQLYCLLIQPTDQTIMLSLSSTSLNLANYSSYSGFSFWLQNDAIFLYLAWKVFHSTRSPTLSPYLWIFAAQVGPIPFLVVPRFCLSQNAASSQSWYFVTRWARSERNMRLEYDSLFLSSWLNYLNMPSRLTTTPFPKRFRIFGETMAEGTRWKAYLTPFLTTV